MKQTKYFRFTWFSWIYIHCVLPQSTLLSFLLCKITEQKNKKSNRISIDEKKIIAVMMMILFVEHSLWDWLQIVEWKHIFPQYNIEPSVFCMFMYLNKCVSVSSCADGRNGRIVYVKTTLFGCSVVFCIQAGESLYILGSWRTYRIRIYINATVCTMFNVKWWIHAVKIHIWLCVFECVCVRVLLYRPCFAARLSTVWNVVHVLCR